MIGLLWWVLAGLVIGAAITWSVIDDWVKQTAKIGDMVKLTKRIKHELDTGKEITVVQAGIFGKSDTKEFEATRMDDELSSKFGSSNTYIYTVRG